MAFGIDDALSVGGLGAKLVGGWLKGRSEKKKAKAKRKEQEELYAARKGQFEAGQARRSSKLNAEQGAIGKVGGALPAGAPDYSFDPAVLAEMQKALPFAETVGSQNVEPTAGAGAGSAMLGGFMNALGGAAETASAGMRPDTGVQSVAFNPGQDVTVDQTPGIEWDPTTGSYR